VRDVAPIDDLTRLRLAIRDELAVQHGIGRRDLDDASWLDVLSEMLAARVDYGFDVHWAPKWVRPGEPHTWTEAGEFFVECLRCRTTTAHPTDAEARKWYEGHRSEHA
jgi:hypothetical protein